MGPADAGLEHSVDASARRRAETPRCAIRVSLVALLLVSRLRNVVSTSQRGGAAGDDVRDSSTPVGKLLLTRAGGVDGNGQGLEAARPGAGIRSESLVNAAVPVARNVVVERCHDTRSGDEMGVVQARVTEIASDHELADFRQGADGNRGARGLIIARERKVHSGAVLAGDEVDGVLHHGNRARQVVPLGVEGRVRPDDDHVARHGR